MEHGSVFFRVTRYEGKLLLFNEEELLKDTAPCTDTVS